MKTSLWFLVFVSLLGSLFLFQRVEAGNGSSIPLSTFSGDRSDMNRVMLLMRQISNLESTYRSRKSVGADEAELEALAGRIESKREELERIREQMRENAQRGARTARLSRHLAQRERYRTLAEAFATAASENLPSSFTESVDVLKQDSFSTYRNTVSDVSNAQRLEEATELLSLLSESAEDIERQLGLEDLAEKVKDAAFREQLRQLRVKARALNQLRGEDSLEAANPQALEAAERAYNELYNEVVTQVVSVVESQRAEFQKNVERSGLGLSNERNIHRWIALQVGARDPQEEAFRTAGCDGIDYDEEVCGNLEDLTGAERTVAQENLRLRLAGAETEETEETAQEFRDVLLTEAGEGENVGECSTEGAFGEIAGTVGGALGTAGGKLLDAAAWTGGKLVSGAQFLTGHGAAIGQALFPVFSALAAHHYTKKGSRNSETQVYRGLAIALGLGLGSAGKLPPGMEKMIDPLEPFKREPLALQALVAEQDQALFEALTMGGDPNRPSGFPYGTHEQLQTILQGSLPRSIDPSSSLPVGVPPEAFAGNDPNFYNFSAQAYNGFPPLPNQNVSGAFLNPQFGSQNPSLRGSGVANFNRQSVGPAAGFEAFQRVLGATEAQRAGVSDFAERLDDLNPPDNSLASLIDEVGPRSVRDRSLHSSESGIRGLLARGEADPEALRNLRIQRDAALGQELDAIRALDSRLPAMVRETRRLHALVSRDEDGLFRTGGHHWSRNMQAYTEALRELREITQQRAQHIEAIAVVRSDLDLYLRLTAEKPSIPSPEPTRLPTTGAATSGAAIYLKGFLKTVVGPFLWGSPVWAREAPSRWVSNWRDLLMQKRQKILTQIEENKNELSKLVPKLKDLVSLNPNGVHEVNMAVIQAEKFNMKSLALQARQNLDRLRRAEEVVRTHMTIPAGRKKGISQHIKNYRSVLVKLEKEAFDCEHQLARVEKLQFEKIKRFDAFYHEKELAQKLLRTMTF